MAEILRRAEEREIEQKIIEERVLRKEREKDDHLYGGLDKFVTSGYKEEVCPVSALPYSLLLIDELMIDVARS